MDLSGPLIKQEVCDDNKLNCINKCNISSSNKWESLKLELPLEVTEEIIFSKDASIKQEVKGSVCSNRGNQDLSSDEWLFSEVPLKTEAVILVEDGVKLETEESVFTDDEYLLNHNSFKTELSENSKCDTDAIGVEDCLEIHSKDHQTDTKQHMKSKSEKFICDKCEFSSKDKEGLYTHKRRTHSDQTELFKYLTGCYTTQYEENLKARKRRIHTENTDKFKCNQCSYIAKSQSYLTQHKKRTHTECNTAFICNVCNFSSKYKWSLSNHMKRNHIPNVDVFRCDKCPYTAKCQDYVAMHMKRKVCDVGKIFKCNECDFKCKYKHNLYYHVRRNHTRKAENYNESFKCIVCGTILLKSDNVTASVCICAKCSSAAASKSDLEKFISKTQDEDGEVFECDLCDHCTRYRDCVLTHIKRKHAEPSEMFECDICGFSTKYKGSLEKHTKSKMHTLEIVGTLTK